MPKPLLKPTEDLPAKLNNKTIVFVNAVGAVGGAERVLLTILAALRTAEPSLQLYLIVGADGPLVAGAKALGVEVKILPLPEQVTHLGDSALKEDSRVRARLILLWDSLAALPAIAQYLLRFWQTLQHLKPNLIHSNGIKTHLLTGLLGLKFVPLVWHIHDFYSTRPLIARVLKGLSWRATVGIAISKAIEQDARAALPQLPIQVIYNSVDTHYFSPGCADLNRFNIPSDRIRVGLVATFARWKGHDLFLESAAQVIRDRPDLNVHFYIVGGAIYQTKGSQFSEQELRDRALALQIADRVNFLGFQQNITEIYRWLDLVIHASTQPEPFGLAIAEAMACGKPVIVSQAGGAAELFTHNYDAFGVKPGDRNALAAAILYLIDNPQQRQYLAENARNTVLQKYNRDRLGKQILEIYQQLIARSSSQLKQ